jgi:ADP-ribose pyrophosphatase YjhB (NUDIX family)
MKNEILKAFLYNDTLKFNEIEKKTRIRSNKLAYYLREMVLAGVLSKKEDGYSLSEEFEKAIPYISDKRSVLPVVLIAIGKQKSFFLYRREKKPYKDFLGLPGGRVLIGERIEDSVKRIMKQKYNIDARLSRINSVSLEHVKKKGKIIHSFFLILVSAATKDKIILTDINECKGKIIDSDYSLLQKHLGNEVKIPTINSFLR